MTGLNNCVNTPYQTYTQYKYLGKSTMPAAEKELDFLIHLLPEGETAIVDGWEYGWRWE
jgi:hypothetical protein